MHRKEKFSFGKTFLFYAHSLLDSPVAFSTKWYWLLPLSWGAVIIYLSLLPSGAGILTLFGIPHFDKVLHAGAYGLLAFLSAFASYKTSGPSSVQVWIILGICVAMGCLLEWGQYYMHAGRSFETWDMAANAVGGIGGILGFTWIRNWFRKK